MENKITVEAFYNKYSQLSSDELKNKMIESLVCKTYIPILEKKIIMQSMFDKSLVGTKDNMYVDMFIHKINTTVAILEMYTKLTFKKDENSDTNIFDDYDILAKNGLLNAIFGYIPESELTSILSINDQIMSTFYNEQKSVKAYVSSLIDKLSLNLGSVANAGLMSLSETIKDEDKMKDLVGKIANDEKIVSILSKLNK